MDFYPKINGVYKRHTSGPLRGRFIMGDFARPEFQALLKMPWYWSHKWDGTSAGVYFGVVSHVFGRSSGTQMSEPMRAALTAWAEGDGAVFHQTGLTVYGEVVGPKIQGNPHGLDEVRFVPFDVLGGKKGRTWWPRYRVAAEVPGAGEVVGRTLADALGDFHAGSLWARTPVEGYVGTPDLCDLEGVRIVTKLKKVDFAHLWGA